MASMIRGTTWGGGKLKKHPPRFLIGKINEIVVTNDTGQNISKSFIRRFRISSSNQPARRCRRVLKVPADALAVAAQCIIDRSWKLKA